MVKLHFIFIFINYTLKIFYCLTADFLIWQMIPEQYMGLWSIKLLSSSYPTLKCIYKST